MEKVLKGFSEKKDGSMYFPVTEPIPENIANRKRFFESHGLGGRQIVVANLVHGTNVEVVDATTEYRVSETDALVTKESGIVLTLTFADCFPVYFEERTTGIIGIAHCGWRGIVGGIVPNTIKALVKLGGKTENMVLTIGPGICVKHFEIKEDVFPSFSAYTDSVITKDGKSFVDLKKIILKQALIAGITPKNIVDWNECTFCNPKKFFSYRRDKPQSLTSDGGKATPLKAQMAYIVQSLHRKF